MSNTTDQLIDIRNTLPLDENGLPMKPVLPLLTMGINRDGCLYGYGDTPDKPKFTWAENAGLFFFGKPTLGLTHHVTRGSRHPYLNIYLNTVQIDDGGFPNPDKNGLTILKMKMGNNPVQNAPVTFLGDLRKLHAGGTIDREKFNGIIYTNKGTKGGIFAHIYSIDNQPLAGMPLSRDPEKFQTEVNALCHSLGQSALFPVNVDVIPSNCV